MAFNNLKILTASALLIYVLMASYTFFTNRREIYPFYDWDLFSTVPQQDSRYFLKVDGKILFGPEIKNYLEIDYLPEYFFKTQDLGRLFEESGDRAVFNEIESKFVTRPISYKIVRAEYNPRELVISGKTISEEVLGKFDVK